MTKSLKLRASFALLVVLAVGATMLFLPGAGEAIEELPGQSWESTPEAQARTLAGDCYGSMLCKELCYFGQPTGEFNCFPY